VSTHEHEVAAPADPGRERLAASPQDATLLASTVGNAAFSRAVAPVRGRPSGPQVQRLIPLAIIGAGLIYVSGEQRGWWGGDEVDTASKVKGGAERLTKVKEERSANLRSRHTLNRQLLGPIEDLTKMIGSGKREDAEKVVRFGQPLFGVLDGLAVGAAQRPAKEAAQDAFGEGFQTAAALTQTREEVIAMCKNQFAIAAAGLSAVITGSAAPGPAPAQGGAPTAPGPSTPTPAPAPVPAPAPAPSGGPAPDAAPAGPPKPPIPADVVSSLQGAVDTLKAAQAELDALGQKGDPGDVIRFTEELQPLLETTSAGLVGEDATKVQSAGFQVRNGVRRLRALTRSNEENGAHAATAFRDCRTKLSSLFQGLLETDKQLEEEERQLQEAQASGADEAPPPTEGGT
jgi:hypothetical protein